MTGDIEIVDHFAAMVLCSTGAPAILIAETARVSTQRDTDPETSKAFVQKLMKWGHWTPFEFVDLTFYLTTSRAVANELVRHRLMSFVQESQRYVRYDKGLRVIVPEALRGTLEEEIWQAHMRDTYDVYLYLLEKGVRPEDARTVLPLATATNMIAKMNLREFRHFLNLRTDKPAWREMRILANLMAEAFAKRFPDEVFLIEDVWHKENT